MTESEAVRRLHALPPVGSRVRITYDNIWCNRGGENG